MRNLPRRVLELPLEQRAEMAMKAAVQKVIEEHAREGLPLYVWSGDKVVAMSAKDLRSHLQRRLPRRKKR